MAKLRVAVIGAGAAGLCAARYMTAKLDTFEPVVYEQTGQLGGTWVYSEQTGLDKHGLPIHSSMYHNLKTNLPKEVMAFPDFPFRTDLPSFISHKDVLQYLEDYANHFDLGKHIKYRTLVEKVSPMKMEGKDKWVVQVRHLEADANAIESNVFDGVIVCNGHHSVPHTPDIPGLETFTGRFCHSHEYRHPEPYKDQTVAFLGARASGQDIALDVATYAKKVYLCHWNPRLKVELPHNVDQMAAVKQIRDGNVLVMEDGAEKQVDAIIACTGYKYIFPFLSPECQLTITNSRIHELYMHLFHMSHPSLSFIGITSLVSPLPQFSMQTRFAIGVLDNSITLPSREEMEKAEKDRLSKLLSEEGGMERHYHWLGSEQWSYARMLADRGGFKPLDPVVEQVYEEVWKIRAINLMHYKRMNFRVLGPQSWERIDNVDI